MKLEIGKRYVLRNGEVTGPLRENRYTNTAWVFEADTGDGAYSVGFLIDGTMGHQGSEHACDIVAEYVEPLKLEVGKRYVTRDGRITEPLVKGYYSSLPFIGRVPHRETEGASKWAWKPNGQLLSNEVTPLDLVAEYVEPPCTETSNEAWGCHYTGDGKVDITAGVIKDKDYAGEYKFIPGDPTFPAYQFTGKIGIPGDPETDLREAIEVIRKQHAEIQAYRTILKGLL